MASSEPSIDNAVPVISAFTFTEQQAAAEPAGTKGEDAETATAETPAAADASPAGEKDKGLEEMKAKWPGWPGYSVFRLVVPVLKVGGIIGRKGDLIKKLVEETRARVRVLDGPLTSPDRIVILQFSPFILACRWCLSNSVSFLFFEAPIIFLNLGALHNY